MNEINKIRYLYMINRRKMNFGYFNFDRDYYFDKEKWLRKYKNSKKKLYL